MGTEQNTHSLTLWNPPYLVDHRAEDRSILPAVEALSYLARLARELYPDLDINRSRLAEFMRFLPLPPEVEAVEADAEIEQGPDGVVTARLLTRSKMGSAGLMRSKLHVEVEFGAAQSLELPPYDTLVGLEGLCTSFSSKQLYDDMVPFGPAFHNAQGPIHLSEAGVVARIKAADHPAPVQVLGNTFVLDTAFHLACAWGQRYAARLTFPTGYTERIIEKQCRTGEEYFCRVIPSAVEPEVLMFDMYIFADDGTLHEACLGVKMQDVARGRMKPCQWVQEGLDDPLLQLRSACAGLTVVELPTLAPFYERVYSARERGREMQMGPKRSLHFAGARVALKQLARRIRSDVTTLASELETVSPDRIHPLLPLPEDDPIRYCAAAHDSRYAVAVAADSPVGIDVEVLSDRVLAAQRIYLSEKEQLLVRDTSLDSSAACALRIWTTKEACAKALDIHLAKAFSRVQVEQVLGEYSQVNIDGHSITARHELLGEHLFTLVLLPDGVI